jgi:predicted permease
MDTLIRDIRYAARLLRRSPLFTLTAALSIAVGVGVDTTVFSVANALLFRQPVAVRAPERLVDISRPGGGTLIGFISYSEYRSARDRFTAFDGVYAHDLVPKPMSVVSDGIAERVSGNIVTSNYFDVLGVLPAAGRLLHVSDGDAPGSSPYVVLSHRFWSRRFNRDPAVVGRNVTVNGQALTIAGVAAEGFQGTTLLAPDVWLPVSVALNGAMAGGADLLLGGRLKSAVSIAEAQNDVRSVGLALQREDRGSGWDDVQVTPLAAIPADALPVGPFFAILLAAVSLLLAIACANLTSSLLARAAARQGEFAIRTALGAGRHRLVRQLLVETALLFLVGGLGGVGIARALSAAITSLLPSLPLSIDVSFATDWRVFTFALALALAAGLASGLLPALHASQTQIRIETHRLRHAFLVAQVALAIVLVVSAGLLGRALRNAASVDVGYDPRGVQLAAMNLSLAGISQDKAAAFARELRERMQQIPAVASVTVAATVPLGDPIMVLGGMTLPGQPVPERRGSSPALGNAIEPGYFATMQIPIVAGRDFGEADTAASTPVAIVGEATSRRLWPDGGAIGRQIVVYQSMVEAIGGQRTARPSNPVTRTIVGIAKDVKYVSLADATPPPFVYIPLQQRPADSLTLIVRAAGTSSIASEIRATMAALNPSVPVTFRSASDNLLLALLPQRIAATVSGTLGVVGLLVAALGIYGVMAYSVTRRTREIAIRVAVGAAGADVARLILRQGLTLAATGGVIGLVLAAIGSQLLRRLLFGVPPLDPVAFGGTVLLFAAVTLLACYVPTRRATLVDPAEALRQVL